MSLSKRFILQESQEIYHRLVATPWAGALFVLLAIVVTLPSVRINLQ